MHLARLSLVLLALAVLVLFMAAVVMELINGGRVFKGVTIAGEPVGGMTKARALKVAETKAKPLSENLVLYYADREFELEPGSYSVRPDPGTTAFAAYLKGRDQFLPLRLFRRLFGISRSVDIPVMYTCSEKKLKALVEGVAGELNRVPTSARIDVSSGRPKIVPSRNGINVNVSKTASDVVAGLPSTDRRVPVVVEYSSAELTEKDIDKVLVVKLSEFRLYLYHRDKYVDDFLVAIGLPEYPTPTGKFHITYKEKNPTWLPTSEWAKDKRGIPQPPGKDNPLGDYWFDIGGGYGIHGTPFVKSLGEKASHGCIRMANDNARVLFETVNVGAPVFIIE